MAFIAFSENVILNSSWDFLCEKASMNLEIFEIGMRVQERKKKVSAVALVQFGACMCVCDQINVYIYVTLL